jgi:acetate kinase
MHILLLNAGSSSLKASLVESPGGVVVARGDAEWSSAATKYRFFGASGDSEESPAWRGHAKAVERFSRDLSEAGAVRGKLAAVGHRVVHGGPFTSSVLISPAIRSRLEDLAPLAPLHNPPALETLTAAEALFSGAPHVAVFDTAFHATLAPEAYTDPAPELWTREFGVRRYGFHGLSHDYCAQRAAEMLARSPADLRLVICHLGHGCSAAAVKGGVCVDTTMGFTPMEGLMMATRCGSIDPGAFLYVQRQHKVTAAEVETALNRQSGLLGVSGVSADMRQVLAAAKAGNEKARLALAIYVRRVRQAIGALAVSMGGVDALVFTAGVGEHASQIRASVCEGLECLGLAIDAERNSACQPDADIAAESSPGRILVIATREDATMLEEVVRVLKTQGEVDAK